MKKTLLALAAVYAMSSCNRQDEDLLFKKLQGKDTGIQFVNELKESMSENMFFFSNYYTGSGVGILDVNNDGLPDVLLGGNQVSSRLYLNKGDMEFEDITASSGIGTDRWVTGVSVVDLNADGFDDVYFSVSGFRNSKDTRNLLFINNGDQTFTESAEAYGLDEKAQTTHTSFFDFDKDGDLDAYMAVNPSDYGLFYMGRKTMPKVNGEALSTDKLYENMGNGTFREVSRESGILIEGYSLGVNTSDFNDDGLTDVFVANDFIQNDILYINQGDGTFINELSKRFEVTTYASMGTDAADINNDGLVDLMTLDMLPETSQREKVIVPHSSYNYYMHTLSLGYHPQFSRNVLQLNNGDGTFAEIGQLAGINRTDWSWSCLFADLDNDGFKDLYVTNGFRRELGNLDYIVYDEHSPFTNPDADLEGQINKINNTPGIPMANYVFKNNGDLTFTKKVKEWGLEDKTFSSGAATADLDLDGDLDLVVNNIDMEAGIYENRSEQLTGNHFLNIQLRGDKANTAALGAKVYVHQGNSRQMLEVNPYRGYQSTVDDQLHFGMGSHQRVDSLRVKWPDGQWSVLYEVPTDTLLVLDQNSRQTVIDRKNEDKKPWLFTEVTETSGIDFRHEENDQVDFHRQFLLAHQHSKLGPGIAVGDVNGDGLDDCFLGGAYGQAGKLYLQNEDGKFSESKWIGETDFEDMGALLFDYDHDGDLDLYVASGGTHSESGGKAYQDRLYANDGKGHFRRTTNVLPDMVTSTATVNAADFDQDGDLDLFVGGRVVPSAYPTIPESYLLRNDKGVFHNVTGELAPELETIGMVSQAIWTDLDNDLDPDLMLVGEWMPATVFLNQDGKLVNSTEKLGLSDTVGWWNSINALDLNADGHMDYLLGNLGSNNDYQASDENPLVLVAKDFDNNGSIDPILIRTYVDGFYPVHSRDAFLGQLSYKKPIYTSYESYASTTGDRLFEGDELEGAVRLEAKILSNAVLMNYGQDSLALKPLDNKAQLAPVFGTVTLDLDGNGYQAAVFSGNLYSSNVSSGPYTASTGGLLRWPSDRPEITRGHNLGLKLNGDRKSLSSIQLANGQTALISAINGDRTQAFVINKSLPSTRFMGDEFRAKIELEDGRELWREVYYGSGYLSQSSRHINLPAAWKKITFFSYTGEQRILNAR